MNSLDDLNSEIAAAIQEGNVRIELRNDEIDQAVAQRQAEEIDGLIAKWQPLIDAIKACIPPWAHQFLTHPLISPDYWHLRAATIAIPDTATIFAYGETSSPVRFRPARYAVSDDDETWDVITLGSQPLSRYELDNLTTDFHIALAAAAAEHKRLPELHAEADRRNAERQKVQVEQPPTKAFDWLQAAIIAADPPLAHGRDMAIIGYALIGILEQLRLVTTPMYDGAQHAIQTYDNSR